MSRPIRPQTLSSADRQCALAVLLVLLGLYAATLSTPFDNPDAEVEYQTTRSLALGRGLALGTDTPEGAALVALRFNVREGAHGGFYSWFGVGQAALAVPLWWAGRLIGELGTDIEARHAAAEPHMGVARSEYFPHLLVAARNPLLGAATAALLLLCARRLGASRPAAFAAALLFGVTTFAWPQARSSLSDVQAAFFVVLAFDGWLATRAAFVRLERPRRRVLLLLGFALAGAGLTRVAVAPALVVIAAAVVWTLVRGHYALRSQPLVRRRSGPRALAADAGYVAAPALGGFVLLLLLNAVRFGDPLETGYGAALGSFFDYSPLLGAAGLLVSPGRGLVWMAPLIVLVPFGLWRGRGDRSAWLVVVGASAGLLALVAPSQGWHGAWTFGPRYLLPALPLLWCAVAIALDPLARSRFLMVLATPLVVAGLLVALGGVFVDHSTHQDLAIRAARTAWPADDALSEREADEGRFLNIQWDWRFAAPWAHWRILRHRVAGLGEDFPLKRLFGVDEAGTLAPTHARDRGFSHFAWVDLHRRLGGRASMPLAFCVAAAALGIVFAVRALDPTRP